LDLTAVAPPALRDLVAETGESAFLGVLDDTEVVYLLKEEGRHSIRTTARLGSRRPLHCTGLGKALLAALPPGEVAALLARAGRAPPDVRAKALDRAGWLAQQQGDYDEAEGLNEQALALRRELGDEAGIASVLSSLGILAGMRGDYVRAWAVLEECLALTRTLGDRQRVAGALMNLGITARRLGEFDRAVDLYEECLPLGRDAGDMLLVANTLLNLGNLHGDLDQPEPATARYRESLAIYRALQDRLGAARCLGGLAEIAGKDGDARRAARLCGAADGLREAIGAPLPPNGRAAFDRTVAAARATLGEAEFSAVWAAGAALPLDDAIDEAVAEASPA